MATPLIIFGLNRTGTTGLLNILKQNLDLTVAYHELNFGSCEINLYRIAKKYSDFKSQNEFVSFLDKYRYSDVFVTLNGDYDLLKQKPFKNFYEFFFYLMDQAPKTYWAFKLEPQILHDKVELKKFEGALSAYKPAKYISIKRKFEAYLNSVIGLFKKNNNYTSIVDLIYTAEYYHYYRLIDNYLNNKSALQIRFQELSPLNNLSAKLTAFLDVENVTNKSELNTIIKNTSANSTFKLSASQVLMIFLLKNISPLRILFIKLLESRRTKKFGSTEIWNTRIHKAKTNPELLIRSFEGKYEEILIPVIKEKYLN